MKLIALFFIPVWIFGQAPKDSIGSWMAPANTATISLNNAYKYAFTQLNNYIGIAAKRQDSLRLQLGALNVAKNRTQDSLLSLIQKQTISISAILTKNKTQDSIITVLLKKRTQDSIAYQHDLIAGRKDQLSIKQSGTKPPYKFEFGFDQVFTDDYAALKKAYDALKKRMDAYDASKPGKTVTIQFQ